MRGFTRLENPQKNELLKIVDLVSGLFEADNFEFLFPQLGEALGVLTSSVQRAGDLWANLPRISGFLGLPLDIGFLGLPSDPWFLGLPWDLRTLEL